MDQKFTEVKMGSRLAVKEIKYRSCMIMESN